MALTLTLPDTLAAAVAAEQARRAAVAGCPLSASSVARALLAERLEQLAVEVRRDR
jgi:hypothetical protein